MRSRRKLWALASVAVGLLAVGAIGGWYTFRGKVAQAAGSLLEDALAMALEPRTRPPHDNPTVVGTFGKCAEPRLDAWVDLLKDEPEVCKEFRAAKAPMGKIPDECLALVTPTNSLAWARGLMSCSRADTAGLPEGLFTTGHKRNGPSFQPWLTAARVLAWEVRAQVATKQYGLAFETCADVIATSRDLSWGGAIHGSMWAIATLKTVYPACAEAVAAADPSSRAKFHAALEAIRAARRTNSSILRDETVGAGIEVFGFELDGRQLQRLPKELRERVRPAPVRFPARIAAGWQLIRMRALTADLLAIADFPDADRAPRMAMLAAREGDATDSPSVGLQEKFLRRLDDAAGLVEMLSAAANADRAFPENTASFTVNPLDGGVELVPVEPESAGLAITVPTAAPIPGQIPMKK